MTNLQFDEILSEEVMVKQISRLFRYTVDGKTGEISVTMPPEFWLEPRWVWEPVVRQAILSHAQGSDK